MQNYFSKKEKRFKGCLITSVLSLGILVLLGYCCQWIWPELDGCHPLGKCLYLWYFEKDRILVLGQEPHSSFSSPVGLIIPTLDHAFEETIVDVNHNKDWVILKSLVKRDSLYRYYILDKSFDDGTTVQRILNEYLHSFPDAESFDEGCRVRGIDLHFKTRDKPRSRRKNP